VKVLMHEDNAEKLNSVLAMLNREMPKQIIPLGRAETMFRVSEALSRNEIVGLLADRIVAGDKMLLCNFLDADAPFPEGAFHPCIGAQGAGGAVLGDLLRWPALSHQFRALRRFPIGAVAAPRRLHAAAGSALRGLARPPLQVRSLTTGSISMIFGPMSSNAELTWSRRLSLVVALIAMAPAAGAFDMAELMALMARVETEPRCIRGDQTGRGADRRPSCDEERCATTGPITWRCASRLRTSSAWISMATH
jgi:hypothetical protein